MIKKTTMFVLCIAMLALSVLVYQYEQDEEVANAKNETLETSTVNSEGIFSLDEIYDVNIEIAEEDFEDMLENPLDEEYKNANVTYNGNYVGYAAIRTKGNTSLSSVASSDSNRYSFKIKFDEYIDDQNLQGYTVINLNNNFNDPTYIREYLSYELLDSLGLATPDFGFVNVYINGELYGLYLAVEQINDTFISHNFSITDGKLYKPDGTGSDLVYTGDDESNYTGLNLKTEQSDGNTEIMNLIETLNQGYGYEEYLDVDSVLKYTAACVALGNYDSYLGSMQHNYYLYEQDGVFSIIGWDFNMSFAGFTTNASIEDLLVGSIDNPCFGLDRPLIDVLLENEEYQQQYYDYLDEIVNGFLDYETFEAHVYEVIEMIDRSVEADPTKFYTYEEFKSSLTSYTESQMFANAMQNGNDQQQNGLDDSFNQTPNQNKYEGGMFNESDQEDGNGSLPGFDNDNNFSPPDVEEGTFPDIEGGQMPSINDTAADYQENGNNNGLIGLLTFVEARSQNIKQQLDGTIDKSENVYNATDNQFNGINQVGSINRDMNGNRPFNNATNLTSTNNLASDVWILFSMVGLMIAGVAIMKYRH